MKAKPIDRFLALTYAVIIFGIISILIIFKMMLLPKNVSTSTAAVSSASSLSAPLETNDIIRLVEANN